MRKVSLLVKAGEPSWETKTHQERCPTSRSPAGDAGAEGERHVSCFQRSRVCVCVGDATSPCPTKKRQGIHFLVGREYSSLLEIKIIWKEDGFPWVIQPESLQEDLSCGGAATWTPTFPPPLIHCPQAPTCLV